MVKPRPNEISRHRPRRIPSSQRPYAIFQIQLISACSWRTLNLSPHMERKQSHLLRASFFPDSACCGMLGEAMKNAVKTFKRFQMF